MSKKKYTNVVSSRPFGSSFIGETSNNKAGFNVVDKEVVDGLKKVKANTKTESIKNTVLGALPFGTAYSVASGLSRDYVEGDLTKQNWLTKAVIHSNPNLNTKEFSNDELNQFKGNLVTNIRNSNKSNNAFNNVDLSLDSDPNNDYFQNLINEKSNSNIKSKISDLEKIDSAKAKEFEEISKGLSTKNQERLAFWKASAPEERRFIDDQKRFTINKNQSLDSHLNKRALGEGNVVPDLNDIDKSYLSDDWKTGADIHKDIGDENLSKAQDPKNVDENGKPKENSTFNTASDKYNNIGAEQFGDGTKNALGLGAGASATGLGVFLNNYWVAIIGVIILVGVVIYLSLKDKNKTKSKKKTYTKRKYTTKTKKSSNIGSNPINIFLGDVKKSAQAVAIPKTKSEALESIPKLTKEA